MNWHQKKRIRNWVDYPTSIVLWADLAQNVVCVFYGIQVVEGDRFTFKEILSIIAMKKTISIRCVRREGENKCGLFVKFQSLKNQPGWSSAEEHHVWLPSSFCVIISPIDRLATVVAGYDVWFFGKRECSSWCERSHLFK